MSIVTVEASRSYDVVIDEMPLDDIGVLARRSSNADVAFVVSDSNVAPLYLERTIASLTREGYRSESFVFEAGESSKTVATYAACLESMARARLTRSSLVIALGGGVVGDLAGFAAATYMRGCRCIQVPTSLLACVDSSVGGKTAVNLPEGKNLAGAFFQPDTVLIDTALLETLPRRRFVDGCAEVLKYGIVFDDDFFEMLKTPLMPGDARLPHIIRRCVELKRDVVQADEHESGKRRLLNFGHTLGHAIERESRYSISHGFAVAHGMVLMAKACAQCGICPRESYARIRMAAESYGFDVQPSFSASALSRAALADKKRTGDEISIVALREIGDAFVMSLPVDGLEPFVARAYV